MPQNHPARADAEGRPQRVPRTELAARRAAVSKIMDRLGIDVALLTTPESIYYLSGYHTRAITSSQALVLSGSGDMVLVTRDIDAGNYLRIRDEAPITDFVSYGDDQLSHGIEHAADIARKLSRPGVAIGVEPASLFMSWQQFERVRELLVDGTVDIGEHVDRLRWIKSEWEIACHRASAAITNETMQSVVAELRPGVLDSRIAADITSTMLAKGSEWVASWPIVQTGPHTGDVHSSWMHEQVVSGQPTSLEFSSAVHRYHSPLFRTAIFNPTAEQKHVAQAVAEAHKAGVAAVRPGCTAEEPYLAEAEVMREHGFQNLFATRVGYMVGIAFSPNWVQRNGIEFMKGNRAELMPGMVFHMVTIALHSGEFAIAHSSTVLVNDAGCEVLTLDGRIGPALFSGEMTAA